ncbi:MAG TPA: hypothetical protein VI750_10920 [Pyrinomonadaceae bacterium]|nr:hypothetical protein [Pyrinomonadaceae bacterium]
MDLQRSNEWLELVVYPPLEEIGSYELAEEDVVVTCAGFEDRAFEFLRRIVRHGSRRFGVIAIDYLPAEPANRTIELEQLVEQSNARLQSIKYDRQDPHDPSSFVLERVPNSGRLFIDTSGMSRLLIVQLVCAIVRANRSENSHIVYAEAEQYPPTKDEVDKKFADADKLFSVINFISSGVLGIIVPPELSTVAMYGQPIRLIAFPSFNPAQFAALCAEINASSYTIIHGKPHEEENAWRQDAIAKLNSIAKLREAEEVTVSTFDYRETLSLLLKVYRQHGDRQKLVIAPTGSKMQALAVGIVSGFLRDLQIVYPAPRSFPLPDNYTKGVSRIYGLGLGFLMSKATNGNKIMD